jgi:hypothetical protein
VREKLAFSSARTMDLIYFEGEFVSGMTIPPRLSRRREKNISPTSFSPPPAKTKEHFEGLNQFLFRFSLSSDVSRLLFADNGRDDALQLSP